jgi:glutamyl-tRNA synthetase
MTIRVRFAPSPTGNVHIGNIRVAIFNWLYARSQGGKFLLRIEDTDLERSTPQAIATLLDALNWLGLHYDEEAVYQTAMRHRHDDAVKLMIEQGHASRKSEGEPTILHLHEGLFDPSFVTEPRDAAEIDVSQGELFANPCALVHETTSSKGEVFTRPIAWDSLACLEIETEDGQRVAGSVLRDKTSECNTDATSLLGKKPVKLHFKRRYVFYDDMVLGRLEKPLDSLRDLVIARSDGSPVFHLANVVDDVEMGITHILRGNDHIENTYRHLFIFKAINAAPPKYAHFPMIVNAKGKPYSKRDGDAYVGDFKEKGFLPECLFNFLALCGWAPGDGREIMKREEMVKAFSLDRINSSAAQFNCEKLEWMNGQYLTKMDLLTLLPLIRAELKNEGIAAGDFDAKWLARLIELEQERMRTIKEFVEHTSYFFADQVQFDEKAVKKVLQKNEGAGLKIIAGILSILQSLADWTEKALEEKITAFAEGKGLKMGDVAQPLRVAITGGTVSPGIWETLFLVGRERALARISRVLAEVKPE